MVAYRVALKAHAVRAAKSIVLQAAAPILAAAALTHVLLAMVGTLVDF